MGDGAVSAESIDCMGDTAEEVSIGRTCGAALEAWIGRTGSVIAAAWFGRVENAAEF